MYVYNILPFPHTRTYLLPLHSTGTCMYVERVFKIPGSLGFIVWTQHAMLLYCTSCSIEGDGCLAILYPYLPIHLCGIVQKKNKLTLLFQFHRSISQPSIPVYTTMSSYTYLQSKGGGGGGDRKPIHIVWAKCIFTATFGIAAVPILHAPLGISPMAPFNISVLTLHEYDA